VEDPDALKGIAFAAFRTRAGELPYQSEQCISVQDALTAYTVAPQSSVGLFGQRGNLVEGQDADIVVLSRDILGDNEPLALRSTQVLATIVAGDLAFKA
jgi:predicted amidohydrolase YtcJ